MIEGVGRLSDAERQAVLDHPEVGADLLEPLETRGAVAGRDPGPPRVVGRKQDIRGS